LLNTQTQRNQPPGRAVFVANEEEHAAHRICRYQEEGKQEAGYTIWSVALRLICERSRRPDGNMDGGFFVAL
jgi:hypothetical protein